MTSQSELSLAEHPRKVSGERGGREEEGGRREEGVRGGWQLAHFSACNLSQCNMKWRDLLLLLLLPRQCETGRE